MLKQDTLTSCYLNRTCSIQIPGQRRKGNGHSLWLRGARGNNLKGVDVEFPLGQLICITGVSGSGKSTLINDTLQPILSQHFYRSLRDPLPYDKVEGLEFVDKVVSVDQSPIRAFAAFQSGYLYRCVQRYPCAFRQSSRGEDTRL